jgi:cysteine desulfurase
MNLIYLDHNSTTPLLGEVAAAMAEWQGQKFGNPSSQHQIGRRARQALEDARDAIGRMLGARQTGRQSDRVIFTSGGTEANNLALLGLAGGHDPRAAPGEAIVSIIEHPSITATADALERRGWKIHRIGVTPEGTVDFGQLDGLLCEKTRWVSVMLANNETGVVQPVAEIARRCAALGIPLHTDAVQMIGKLPVDFRELGASSMSVAPHKFHGPLGIGALVVRHDIQLEPLMFGGFQQEGLRPGTESVALAVGFCAALAAWQREGAARTERLKKLRDRLESALAAGYDGEVVVNGAAAERLPHTSNLALVGLERQALLMALDQAGVACSTGSACASGSSEPSPVLTAMGASKAVLAGSLRFSLGATTSGEEVEEAIARIQSVSGRVASPVVGMSPAWAGLRPGSRS